MYLKLFLKFLFPGLIDIKLSSLENFILTKQHNTCYMKYANEMLVKCDKIGRLDRRTPSF